MLSGCCAKTESFEFGCVENCAPQFVDRIEYRKHKVPDDILQCRALPKEPITADKQSEVSAYIVDLWLTADECKRNLRSVSDVVDDNRSK